MTFADRTRAMHLYRIAQEAISNAIKHGKARKVVVALTGDDEVFELTITDDGTGFQKSRGPAKGMGMKTMAYRARLIGARLETGNNPGGGAYLSCAVVPQTSAKEI
jgi:two-component system CheB/CheR fusion protein